MNAAVIILRYTTLRHNGLWEVIHISSFDTMWRIHAFEVQNHVNYMKISSFRCGADLVYLVIACKKSNLGEALLFQVNLPLFKHLVDKNR